MKRGTPPKESQLHLRCISRHATGRSRDLSACGTSHQHHGRHRVLETVVSGDMGVFSTASAAALELFLK